MQAGWWLEAKTKNSESISSENISASGHKNIFGFIAPRALACVQHVLTLFLEINFRRNVSNFHRHPTVSNFHRHPTFSTSSTSDVLHFHRHPTFSTSSTSDVSNFHRHRTFSTSSTSDVLNYHRHRTFKLSSASDLSYFSWTSKHNEKP